ncbi:MAG TPA: serine/threonine-protein kinase [bacterium]|nr:serine/threonine-protein kinase [bacterium]
MLERFGEYQLIHKIATGGMAEIFLAKHTNSPVTSMPIAIKRILKQFNNNQAFIKMFLAEARIICNITHEHIVKIYDFGKNEETYYIAMEYVFGQSLGQLLNKYDQKAKTLPMENVLEVATAVLSGLEYAHNTRDRNGMFLNVVHLDMNPNNILLSYDGKIKLVDFGIAHATYTKVLKNNLQSVQGTYGYLSPEQCQEKPLDRRSDIFSFAVILYEMLAGKSLFKQMESDAAILNAIVNDEIPDITTINPQVPRELWFILQKALQKNRERRYGSASEMLDDIKRFQNMREFNPQVESLTAVLKREFAAHFIKMNRILEKAQAAYLMDELFKDIGEIEEVDLNEKIRIQQEEIVQHIRKEEEEEDQQERRAERRSWIWSIGGAVAILVLFFAALGVYLFFPFQKDTVQVFIATMPPEADIFVDGRDAGARTPVELQLVKGRTYVFEFRKEDKVAELPFVPSENPNDNKIFVKLKTRQ